MYVVNLNSLLSRKYGVKWRTIWRTRIKVRIKPSTLSVVHFQQYVWAAFKSIDQSRTCCYTSRRIGDGTECENANRQREITSRQRVTLKILPSRIPARIIIDYNLRNYTIAHERNSRQIGER